MNSLIYEYLSRLDFGEIVRLRNVAMIPLFSSQDSGTIYLTLDEAIGQGSLVVTEVSSSGSMPELRVVNNAGLPVLLLDGEELVGAKQNRILNTSILVKEKSETIIPVTCCEYGRWQYSSPAFAASPEVMPASIRSKKLRYVNDSLRLHREFKPQQRNVWNDIDGVHRRSGVNSFTGAMKDAFDLKAAELEEYINIFQPHPEQRGALFMLGGEVLGFDIVSRASAYKVLHPKLVRSYTLDIGFLPSTGASSVEPARSFIKEALRCNESQYPSPGYGLDFRYEGNMVIGSALVHRNEVIHAAFFRSGNPGGSSGGLSGLRKRVDFHGRDFTQ